MIHLDKTDRQGVVDEATLPSEEEIKGRQQWLKSWLLLRIKESWATSRAAFDALPFADKRKFLALILGGRDEAGRRCGVYVSIAGERWGKKAIHYEIRGRLGSIDGWIGEAGEIIAGNTPSLRYKSNLTGQHLLKGINSMPFKLIGEFNRP